MAGVLDIVEERGARWVCLGRGGHCEWQEKQTRCREWSTFWFGVGGMNCGNLISLISGFGQRTTNTIMIDHGGGQTTHKQAPRTSAVMVAALLLTERQRPPPLHLAFACQFLVAYLFTSLVTFDAAARARFVRSRRSTITSAGKLHGSRLSTIPSSSHSDNALNMTSQEVPIDTKVQVSAGVGYVRWTGANPGFAAGKWVGVEL